MIGDIISLKLLLLGGLVIGVVIAAVIKILAIRWAKRIDRLSLESTDHCVILIDKQGQIIISNEILKKYYLYDLNEVEDSSWCKLFTGEDIRAGLPDQILEMVNKKATWTGETWQARKNGTRFWGHIFVVRNSQGYCCLIKDINEQKILADSAAKWKHIFHHGAWAAVVFDDRNLMTHVNESFARMHGYSVEELVKKPISLITAPEFISSLTNVYRSNMGRSYFTYDSVHLRKDGMRFPCRCHVSIFYDENSRPLYYSGIFEDVTTEYKRDRELRSIGEGLKHSNEQINNFVTTLAHELRNPLQPINMSLHIYEQSGEMNSEMVDTIARNVHTIERLVDDLMDVARISKGKIALKKTTVDLCDVINSAIEQTHVTVRQKRHKISKSLPDEPIYLDADPVRLSQVFANLLNNSAKYTDENGHIYITAELEDKFIAVKFRDNGIGIEESMLPKIFELFAQSGQALQRSQGGLGLGLTLVKNLVELHNGTVEAYSEGLGKGSTFIVRLPVIAANKLQKEPTKKIFSGSLNDRKILIVDDNVDAAVSMQMMLSLDGCETIVGYNGEEALQLYDEFNPDIVLLDIGLPKINGFEVARIIRSRENGHVPTLIAVTGYGQPSDIQRSEEVGFDAHVIKPVEPGSFKQLIKSTFEKRAGSKDDS